MSKEITATQKEAARKQLERARGKKKQNKEV